MKKIPHFIQIIVQLVSVIVIALGAILALRQPSGPLAITASQVPGYPPPPVTLTPLPPGYPPPPATIPPPEITAMVETQISLATASAPVSLSTPGPAIGPQLISDPVSRFSLILAPGWYSTVPDTNFASVTSIANYNFYTEPRPPHGISIQVQAGPLPSGKSFEQWLAEYRVEQTSPENGAYGVTLTPTQPYTLGQYVGVSYIATAPDISVLVIAVPSGDRRVAVISLTPYDVASLPSPAVSEALTMLSTINLSP